MSFTTPANPLNVPDRVKLIGALVRERLNTAERAQLRALLEPAPGPNPDGALAPTQLFTDEQLASDVAAIVAGSAFAAAIPLIRSPTQLFTDEQLATEAQAIAQGPAFSDVLIGLGWVQP